MPHRPLPFVETSWTTTSLSQGDVLVVAGHREAAYAFVYKQERSSLYVSTNLGTTWHHIQGGLPDDIYITAMLADAERYSEAPCVSIPFGRAAFPMRFCT